MKRLVLIPLLMLVILLVAAVPVQAETIDPPDDNIASISDTWANQNLVENGDMLIYFKYHLPYAVTPEPDISKTYVFRLFDSTDTTELGYRTAYSYYNKGYGYGICAFYFNAENNPGWGDDYIIRIEGSPAYFSTPFSRSFAISPAQYSSFTTQEANRAEMKVKLIALTKDLQVAWDVLLWDEVDIGTVFSTNGALYFRNAIPGLQAICPDLFYVQVEDLEYSTTDHDTEFQNTIVARFDGTWVGTSLTAAGDFFDVGYQLIGSLVTVVLCIIVVALTVRRMQPTNAGLMDCFTVVILAAAFTLFPFGLMALIVYFCWAYIGYILLFRR